MAKLLHTLIKTNNTHNSSVRSNEKLTLETSALLIRPLSSRLIKPIFCFTFAAPQFPHKVEFWLLSNAHSYLKFKEINVTSVVIMRKIDKKFWYSKMRIVRQISVSVKEL